jgi:outer membrane biosynthesis protein TonB
LALGVAISGVACGGRTQPLPAFPARVDAQCFTPGAEDYAVTIVVRDTMYRDTLWLRPLLDGVGTVWRVETPLRKLSVDIGTTFSRDGQAHNVRVVRRSGYHDFDERALRAVELTMQSNEQPLPERYAADSLRILVRFGPPDVQNALVQTWLSVVRAPRPKRGNPAPDYPADRRAGQRVSVILLVDSLGNVDPESIDVTEATDEDFARAVVDVLPNWRFTPSMVRGCRVARQLRLDFTDKNPD